MNTKFTYFVYSSRQGYAQQYLRIVRDEKNDFYVVVRDLIRMCRLPWPQRLHKRMRSWEKKRMGVDGVSMLTVTLSGLLSIIPQESQFERERKMILEVLMILGNPDKLPNCLDENSVIRALSVYDHHRGMQRIIRKAVGKSRKLDPVYR